MDNNEKKSWSFKDKIEIIEAFFTIVVSVMAIWGTLIAWKNGFWYKLKHTVDHYHEQILEDENNKKSKLYELDKIKKELDKME